MRLDVIIPTYNRSALLDRTLSSFLAALYPAGLEVVITVVDNNSSDETRIVAEKWKSRFDGHLNYLFEVRQGKSYALNSGIALTSGDLVGIIDDDEEVATDWFLCVEKVFSEPGVDFIGGPCIPRWDAEPPDWLPQDYPAVIGKVDGGEKVAQYGRDYAGMLMGGNCVLRRSIIKLVGGYDTDLGRIGDGMLCGEDEDMYRRLLAAGARGFYRPDLVIYHYVPPERLTKRYFRRWCFWRGVSSGLIDGDHPEPVVYLTGIPRYLYGRAARGLARLVKGKLTGAPAAEIFSHELAFWDWAGFFYGKNLVRPKRGNEANCRFNGQDRGKSRLNGW